MLGQFFERALEQFRRANSSGHRPYAHFKADYLLHALEHNQMLGDVKKELFHRLQYGRLNKEQAERFTQIVVSERV